MLHLRPFDGDCSDSELEKLVLFFRQAVRVNKVIFYNIVLIPYVRMVKSCSLLKTWL